jgi:methionine-rich copper-binding protein CopC
MRIRALIGVIAVVFFGIGPVNAHSSLISATPEKGAVLTEFPSEVSLTFNESLLEIGNENPNKVEVVNSMGDLLSGVTTVAGPVITAPLQITGNDVYKVMYRVVSQDGHVIEGEYSFTVESEIATAVPISEPIKEEVAPEDGPNLLVRSVMALAAGVAFVALLRIKKRKK